METVFEVRYICTQKMLREFARKYSVGPRPWTIALLFFSFLFAAAEICSPEVERHFQISTAAVLLSLTVVQFLPSYYAWAVVRNTKKQNDGVSPECVVTFGDTIELQEGMARLTVEYRKLTRGVRLKHSYVLMTGKKTAVMLEPDSFTKGSLPELQAFLREKCPELPLMP